MPTQDINLVSLPSKIRWGYDSLTVPLMEFGMSWRRTTLCRENEAVGPWGKWESVLLGVSRLSLPDGFPK